MKLIGLLLTHLLITTWQVKALVKTPPTEIPCTANVDNEPTCNDNGSGIVTLNGAIAVSSTAKTSSDDKEFKDDLKLITGFESSRGEAFTSSDSNAKEQEVQEPSQQEDATELPFPMEPPTTEDATEDVIDDSIRPEESISVSNVSSSTKISENGMPNSPQSSESKNGTIPFLDAQSDELSDDIFNEGTSQGEKTVNDDQHKDSSQDLAQKISSVVHPQPGESGIIDKPLFYETLNGSSSESKLENAFDIGSEASNDTSAAPKTTDTVGKLQNDKKGSVNSTSDERIAKSIEKGNLTQNEHQKYFAHEPRSLNSNQTVDMDLVQEKKVKLDHETAHKDHFILQDQESLETNETALEQTDDDNEKNYVTQTDSSISTENTYVRKCCEDHEFFSLQTQHCEDAIYDPSFLLYVQHMILVNSTKNLKTITGRLPICPGTIEPPLISAAAFDVHSLEAFGYIRDDANGVTYDHDHYCLELAAGSPDDLDAATLVLAHCLPTSDADVEEIFIETSVRKCCGEQEFFSIRSQQCEPAGGDPGFLSAVSGQLMKANSTADLKHITGLLQSCPGTGEPPLIEEATSASHTLFPTGHLKDHYSAITYNHEHYCLELAAVSRDHLADAPITLAYCLPRDKESYKAYPSETVVRKCCAKNEYFSSRTQQCEPTESDTGFEDVIRGIQIDNSTSSYKYVNGKIPWCDSTNDLPDIATIQPHTHALLAFGHLKDLRSGIKYEHDNYCLELAADSPDELYNGVLLAAYCPIFSVHVLIRKCCNLNQYFDNDSYQCYDRLANMSNYNALIRDFLRDVPKSLSTAVTVGKIKCKNAPLKRVDADDTYLDKTGQLCEHSNGVCHSSSSYCIEHFKVSEDEKLKSGAFICPTDLFNKCCQMNEIYTEKGCVKAGPDYIVSSHINQLMEILVPHSGFPKSGEETCMTNMVKSTAKGIRWWINKNGYLSFRAEHGETTSKHYCVDDYQDGENTTDFVVVMCLKDMEHVLSVEILSKLSGKPTIGKCCQHGQYLQDNVCVSDVLGLNLLSQPQFVAANVTELRFTSWPVCESKMGFHKYPFGHRTTEDFATLGNDNEMTVVSMENGCHISEQKVWHSSYCIDYGVDQTGSEPVILVCPDVWDNISKYQEKYSLTAVLLGISCTALIATAFTLITMRVRRGLVTVKKVNTLAGRILLSYVLSYLLAFLLLAIGMKASTEVGYTCSVLAGFLMFFLLAAFQWNTSICLESLLLTLRVSTSERNRYLCHSLWAWGVPGIITTTALTLDHHKDSLSCSVIIPRIGLYRCFFSDRTAQLLYLYLPMFVSLCANMILLSAARYVRSAKLKRLEKGCAGRPRNTVSSPYATELQAQQSKTSDQQNNSQGSSNQSQAQHSGMRTHQTRNLWTESMKLVVWSGATWMAEVISFMLTRFVQLSESWYNYLWYLPSSINSLRGVGIFVILVLTPENRQKIFQIVGNHLGSWAGSGSLARHSRSGDGHSSSGNNQSTLALGRSSADSRVAGRRNMSIATTVTHLSSIRSGTANETRPETGTIKVHPRVAHSVSQIDTRRGSASSQSSFEDGPEQDSDLGAGGRRKSSLATTFGLVSLPSVDEEDVFDGNSSVPLPPPFNATQSTSDV